MSTGTDALVARFQGLPRAFQWLAWAVLFVALFTAWDGLLGPLVERWNASADRIESDLRSVREAERLNDDLRRRQHAIVAIGGVSLPRDEQPGRVALGDVVVEVLEKHGVRKEEFSIGGGRRLPVKTGAALKGYAKRPGGRLVQLSGDLRFESSPEDAIAVIADLESRDEIESISLVRLRKANNGMLEVQLTVESWVFGA